MVWLSVGTAMSAAKSQENVREFKSAWRVVPGLNFFLPLIAKCGVRCRLFIHVLAFHGMSVCVSHD